MLVLEAPHLVVEPMGDRCDTRDQIVCFRSMCGLPQPRTELEAVGQAHRGSPQLARLRR